MNIHTTYGLNKIELKLMLFRFSITMEDNGNKCVPLQTLKYIAFVHIRLLLTSIFFTGSVHARWTGEHSNCEEILCFGN